MFESFLNRGRYCYLYPSCIKTVLIQSRGRIKSECLPDCNSSCEVWLSPRIFDPCPNSVVEMDACGLPVITTKESGALEIVKYENLIIEEDIKLYYM